MAKEKKLTKEDVLNSIDSFTFEELEQIYNAVESALQAEIEKREQAYDESRKVKEKINGKK